MSLWSRFANVFRPARLTREIDEELQSHLDEAVRHGRDPEEARRAFGSPLRLREQSRDLRLLPWLDSLRADAVFGFRRLKKKKVTSAAAILSLALAIGSCTAAFRLIDALLLRPLPVAHADRLYALFAHSTDSGGALETRQSYEYPLFLQMRAAVQDQAELIAVSSMNRMDLTYGSNQEMEKAYVQYVSGWMFGSFGLRPALGSLLTAADDLPTGSHPYAVISYEYWARRFAKDPGILGRILRLANDGMWKTSEQPSLLEIIGVAPQGFTGTEPGKLVDIFLPTSLHAGVHHPDWTWLRAFALLKPGAARQPVLEKLSASFRTFQQEKAKAFSGRPQQWLSRFLGQRLRMEPARAGVSSLQTDYRVPLAALAALVALVLLISCANVSNLMTAQAAAQARELALRVSIGAGRWRLVQLALMESAWLAVLASALGALLAWWSAPLVVSRINPPDDPVRLLLPLDWRLLAFGLSLAFAVTILLGLAPALRSSLAQPVTALKGGHDRRARRRLMHALIAAQAAFCSLVLLVAGLFAGTFSRLSSRPLGFSAESLLNLDTVAQNPQPPALWDHVLQRLRELPGVQSAALAGWPLMSGIGWPGFISVDGAPPRQDSAEFLGISPGWIQTMQIPILEGRDFRAGDASPGVAIVNAAFAKRYFDGRNPIGRSFAKVDTNGKRLSFEIVGLVRDARYGDLRGPIPPVAYIPFHAVAASGALEPADEGTFIVRTTSPNPLALASILRREVPRAQPEFRVSNIRSQAELIEAYTVRERLLAMLGLFFAMVALVLAGVGLYGVLDYTVLQRRREIGIRMALGARPAHVARRVTLEAFRMVLLGAAAGLALGLLAARSLASLLFQVKPTDLTMLALPALAILLAALLAALPAVLRVVRIDPAATLRAE